MATTSWTLDLRMAEKDLAKLDGAARRRVFSAIAKLEDDPYEAGFPLGKRSEGDLTGHFKIVVGDLRVVYWVVAHINTVVVTVVAPRRDDKVYKLAYRRIQSLRRQLDQLAAAGHRVLQNVQR